MSYELRRTVVKDRTDGAIAYEQELVHAHPLHCSPACYISGRSVEYPVGDQGAWQKTVATHTKMDEGVKRRLSNSRPIYPFGV
jgi:hypothetical protein